MDEIERIVAIAASWVLVGTSACTPDPVANSPKPTPQSSPSPPVEEVPSTVAPDPTPELSPLPNASLPEPTPEVQPATVEVLLCEVQMAQVNDPDPPLNVRSQPDPTQDNIVGTLENGTFLTVETEEKGWLKIIDPIAGWVAKNRTDSECAEKLVRIEFPENGGFTTLKGSFVGTGLHEYTFVGQAGETLTLEGDLVLPFILAPSGTEITGGLGLSGVTTWTGELSESGQYSLQMNSNFRGYEYELFVELK